ncbi:hypothetical protein ACTXT7_005055 [Hymenolepis weldensis]
MPEMIKQKEEWMGGASDQLSLSNEPSSWSEQNTFNETPDVGRLVESLHYCAVSSLSRTNRRSSPSSQTQSVSHQHGTNQKSGQNSPQPSISSSTRASPHPMH